MKDVGMSIKAMAYTCKNLEAEIDEVKILLIMY